MAHLGTRYTYLDTSAFLRGLLADAPDHAAARALLTDPGRRFISSELLWLEAARAGIRIASGNPSAAGLPADIDRALAGVERVDLDRTVLAIARGIPEVVKSLDAIHIATAERLRHSLDVVLTYDATMANVLRAHGLTPATAGDTPPPPRANP